MHFLSQYTALTLLSVRVRMDTKWNPGLPRYKYICFLFIQSQDFILSDNTGHNVSLQWWILCICVALHYLLVVFLQPVWNGLTLPSMFFLIRMKKQIWQSFPQPWAEIGQKKTLLTGFCVLGKSKSLLTQVLQIPNSFPPEPRILLSLSAA